MGQKILNFINKIPKAELHLHIEGSLSPDLMFKLSQRNGIAIPFKGIAEIQAAYNFSNLQTFLDIYYQGANVLVQEQDFFDLTWEYILHCKQDNVVHTEIFFDPQTHTDRGISFDTVINGIHRALLKAEAELGISSKIIMCFLRHLDESEAFKTLEQALAHKEKIIGIGLDSSEVGHPPKKFLKVFQLAIQYGFIPVAHAGEEGPTEYIWEALNLLKVKRIDHGVRCLEDEKLVEHLRVEQIPLTVCPLSNVKLKVFKTLKDHNLRQLLNHGLLAMINSDDPAYFGGYLGENYRQCFLALDLKIEDIKKLAINSFKASFLEDAQKEVWIEKINAMGPV